MGGGRKAGGKHSVGHHPFKADRRHPRKKVEAGEPHADADDNATFTDVGYEVEDELAEEAAAKNRRYDDVDVYEYELPEDFEVRILVWSGSQSNGIASTIPDTTCAAARI